MDPSGLDAPRRLSIAIDNRWGGGEMAVLDFGPPERPVDVIFAHANGFNAATYRSVLAPLSASLRIWAPDLRGHGRTTLPIRTHRRWDWRDHRDDLIALLDAVGGPPVVLSGHSMGGTSALLAAAERPERTASLVLFDPVIWSRATSLLFRLPVMRAGLYNNPLAKTARRRRSAFDSREQALAAYRGRGAFRGWPDAALTDYLSDGLLESEGGYALSATPEWEASNYAAQSHDPWRALRRYDGRTRILKAEIASTCHLATRASADGRRRVEVVPGARHLFPMTEPQVVRSALLDAAV
ncbi:alpha/beta hydrolase [Brevundimonas sp. PAMC22021]|uniref:alpha/beta hydrolase n=1 Tax=Brevundimonas sp. PAMC22021 TaxID=2861285 RepID=UPI001C62DC39|nr:alpha/beta hydrolase [Brevundimonas sp. PAMC22021]QYF86905.1 alpha/beta hydrolase [Brevundimonas sp. PAMC22021]